MRLVLKKPWLLVWAGKAGLWDHGELIVYKVEGLSAIFKSGTH